MKPKKNYSLAKSLIELFDKGVIVFLSDGALKVQDSSKYLNSNEIEALKDNKDKILAFFEAQKISSNRQIGRLSLQPVSYTHLTLPTTSRV